MLGGILHKFKKDKTNAKGFTLIEYILVIALASIIFLALAQAVIITIRSWDISLSGAQLIGQTEVAFSKLTREIRQVNSSTDITIASPTIMEFVGSSGLTTRYELVGTELRRNNRPSIDDVDALTFEYLDASGAVIAFPFVSPLETNIRMVRITLEVSPQTQSTTIRSTIRLRNVR